METKSTSGRSLSDVPHSALVLQSANQREIAAAIAKVGALFTHVEVVQDSPRTARILLQRPSPYSVSLSKALDPDEAAFELCGRGLAELSRYYPEKPESPLDVKGWEIRRALVSGTPAVVVLAAWIRKLAS